MKEKLASPEKTESPSFKFVYVEHDGIENAKLTWAELAECDVILQEETGFSLSQKNKVEEGIRQASFYPFSFSGYRERQKILSRKEFNWGAYLIARAVETKKEFHFIDIRGNDTAKETERDAQAFYKEGFHLLNHGSPVDAMRFMEKGIQKFAEAHRVRTGVIMVQIKAFLEQNRKRLEGKKIGVVQGAAHQATYEAFKTRFPGLESTKAVPISREARIFTNLLINAEISEGNNIPQDEIKKMFLADDILFSYLRVLRPGEKEDRLYSLADDVVESLSLVEVESYWGLVMLTEGNNRPVNETFLSIGFMLSQKYGLEQPSLQNG